MALGRGGRLSLLLGLLLLGSNGTGSTLRVAQAEGGGSEVSIRFFATGGTITTSGLYLAGHEPGAYQVIAARDHLAVTSTVTILTATLTTSALSGSAPWLDEQFTYANTANYWANKNGLLYLPYGCCTDTGWWHQGQISLDRVNTYNGHPTLRYDWPANTGCQGTPTSDYQITSAYRPPPQREMWVEVAHKFAPNFNTIPAGCTGGGYKFMLFWRDVGDRFDLINGHGTHWWANQPQTPASPLQPLPDNSNYACSGVDGNCILGYPTGTWATRLGLVDQAPYLPDVPGRLWDGRWHIYRFHLRISSSASARDGIYRIWIDGKLVANRQNFSSVTGGRYSAVWEYIGLGGNSNSGVAVPTQTWWGHLKVWTSNPGW